MRRSQREKLQRQRTLRERFARRGLTLLMGAALMLPGLGLSSSVSAQTPPTEAELKVAYAEYRDFQVGEDRMRVHAPQAYLNTPVGERGQFEASSVFDAMSGASPLYMDTLSGASGKGIEDNRVAGDGKYTYYFDRFSLAAGMTGSHEDDYKSIGGLVESLIWNEDKSTVFSLGFSGHSDDISSVNDPELEEHRDTYGYLFGVTQVIDQLTLMQSNITITGGKGYFSDPYKVYDNRPDTRDEYAWLTRYIHYFEDLGGSLHTDYRYFFDSWGIHSHTAEVSWYQEVGERFVVRPSLRYYTQGNASFYTGAFPPTDFESNYTADQRLGGFGSISAGLKVIADLGAGFSADAQFQFMEQRQSLKAGGTSGEHLEPFGAYFFIFGLSKKF